MGLSLVQGVPSKIVRTKWDLFLGLTDFILSKHLVKTIVQAYMAK